MTPSTLTIMLLGGARRVSLVQLLKKAGEKAGHPVEVISYDLHREIPVALVAKVVRGLKWDDPLVVDDIERTVRRHNVNVILPIVNGSMHVAAQCRERFRNVFVPISDPQVTAQLFDKAEAAKLFKELNFPIPKTYNAISAQVPAIAKPRHGGSSRGIHIFRNMEDLMHLEDLHKYLVQEYIEHSDEYTVDSYITREGKILTTVPRKRLEVMGGESTRTETFHNETLEKLAREIIRALRLRGPVNLQFLHDLDNDRYLLMEVNPRIGGGVICSVYAGAPITDYIVNEALGNPLEACSDWLPGTLMARYFAEAIFHNQ